MTIRINHNIGSNSITGNLRTAGKEARSAMERLSSGFRINHAGDDPSGLAASERLRGQMASLERAISNTTDAFNVMATADGALAEMNSILKDMRSAAVEAANSGDPSATGAAQHAFDAGYMALERIVSTARFGGRPLLNGAQEIMFSVSAALTGGTQNNLMLDSSRSSVNQIFRRDGVTISIGFNGAAAGGYAAANLGDAAMRAQAAKPYLEIDPFTVSGAFDADGRARAKQVFDLQGAKGSRRFEFDIGASLGDIVSAIERYADSTGVRASLTFNRGQGVNYSVGAAVADAVGKGSASNDRQNAAMYDNYKYVGGGLELIAGSVDGIGGVVYGKNTDGNGDVHVRVAGNGAAAAYEVYKDASLSRESLVASGTGGSAAAAENNSGLSITVGLAAAAAAGDVFRVSLGTIQLNAASVDARGNDGLVDFDASSATGVSLGRNTDSGGSVHLRFEKTGAGGFSVSAYADGGRSVLVARTAGPLDLSALRDGDQIVLDQARDGSGQGSGLGITLKIADSAVFSDPSLTEKNMAIRFRNLGARVYAGEYGSASILALSQRQGGMFLDYAIAGDPGSARLIAAGAGPHLKRGQDAALTINGGVMRTAGLSLDFGGGGASASLYFNPGKSGTTTIAQVGYGEGTLFTKNGSLAFAKSGLDPTGSFTSPYAGADRYLSGLLNNAGHSGMELIGAFSGGMQFQLGSGREDGNRTVFGIEGMHADTLGRILAEEDFDGTGIRRARSLTLIDAIGSGVASLGRRPDLAMRIVDRADGEVSLLRARIGAFQANSLASNESSLRETFAALAQAESAIRDADMAEETVRLTRGMILGDAGAALLAQSNQESMNVLALLDVEYSGKSDKQQYAFPEIGFSRNSNKPPFDFL